MEQGWNGVCVERVVVVSRMGERLESLCVILGLICLICVNACGRSVAEFKMREKRERKSFQSFCRVTLILGGVGDL